MDKVKKMRRPIVNKEGTTYRPWDDEIAFGGVSTKDIQVLKGRGIYYIGVLIYDDDFAAYTSFTRISVEYWDTREEAEFHLIGRSFTRR